MVFLILLIVPIVIILIFVMNLQIFVVKDKDTDYFQALRTFWLGGKNNDVLVVFSVGQKLQIQWVDIMVWAESYALNVSLRDSLKSLKTLDKRIFPYCHFGFYKTHKKD